MLVTVEYRSDGKINKSHVVEALQNLLLDGIASDIFSAAGINESGNNVTWAGYNVALDDRKSQEPKPK